MLPADGISSAAAQMGISRRQDRGWRGARRRLGRELEEELGIRAQIGSKVAQLQHTYLNGNAVELHFFKVEHYEGELQNRIFREVRWVHRRDLPALDFLDADRTLVQQIAEGGSSRKV